MNYLRSFITPYVILYTEKKRDIMEGGINTMPALSFTSCNFSKAFLTMSLHLLLSPFHPTLHTHTNKNLEIGRREPKLCYQNHTKQSCQCKHCQTCKIQVDNIISPLRVYHPPTPSGAIRCFGRGQERINLQKIQHRLKSQS